MLYEKELTGQIIGAAIEVHRGLGLGLPESAYQACLAPEFGIRELPFEQEKPLPLDYKGVRVDCGYRLDFLVDDKVVVELKAVDSILKVHEAQLLTYLRLRDCRLGFLLNWNVSLMKHGIKRMVNSL